VSGSVTVAGGAGGTTAWVEDLLAMARLLEAAGQTVRDVAAELSSSRLRDAVATGTDREPLGAFELTAQLAALAGPFGLVERLGAELGSLGSALLFAAYSYGHTENDLVAAIGRGLFGIGAIGVGAMRVFSGDPVDGTQQLMDGLPGLTGALAQLTAPMSRVYAQTVPDGRPVLHDLGPDTRSAARLPPRTLTDLMTSLELRNTGHDGEVSVSVLVDGDGRRRVIVDIPGTKSWNPVPNRDITSVGTDIRAMAGRDTSYEEGVFAAMRAAGVTRTDPVLLVGHSEGGIIAVNAARDAVHSGEFDITHIVTAGAPIGHVVSALPRSVQVLALENSADLVPAADGEANPDLPNVTTVTVHEQRDSVQGNHGLATGYEQAAAAADTTRAESIRDFLHSARGFFDAPTPMRTHAFWITRDP
jgi:hypothetical protein